MQPGALDPGTVIARAVLARPQNIGATMTADYSQQIGEFLRLLDIREVPYVIVGGIALLQHVQGRNTDDIDLILSAPRLHDIPELEIRERTNLFAYGAFRDLRVDILFAEHPLFHQIAASFAAPMEYHVGRLMTATIDGLLLLKLFALPSLYRQFDHDRIAIYESDITQLLRRSDKTDEFFLQILQPHLPHSDINALRAILTDTRRRLDRSKPKS